MEDLGCRGISAMSLPNKFGTSDGDCARDAQWSCDFPVVERGALSTLLLGRRMTNGLLRSQL